MNKTNIPITVKKRLLEEFESHTYEAWKSAAVALLKGRDFDRTLRTPTYEGITLEPIYMGEGGEWHPTELPGLGMCTRGSSVDGFLERPWSVSQELSAGTPEELNEIALEALTGGQDELNFWLDLPGRKGEDASTSELSVGVCGLSLSTVGDLKRLLQGVHTEMISMYWHAGRSAPALFALLVAALRERGRNLKEVSGCLGFDPVGWKLECGQYPGSEESIGSLMAQMIAFAEREAPKLQVLAVQGHAYHDAGGSSVQEMGAVLATGVYYLRTLQRAGVEPVRAASRIRLALSIGGQTFIEIAKIRAMRRLWIRVLEAFEVAPASRTVHIHGRTGLWNKTQLDPYVNMLRTTTEAFSAVLGGCDSLHVSPFDEVVRESDSFSRRIARNTHAILSEECQLGQVIDPVGGSWAIESLTDQMAEEAWKVFQSIEAEGGILASLDRGSIQSRVEDIRAKKETSLQRRKDVLVGTNSYANASEQLLNRPSLDYGSIRQERASSIELWKSLREEADVEVALTALRNADSGGRFKALLSAAGVGATLGEMMDALDCGVAATRSEVLRTRRGSEQFEQLRFAAKAMTDSGRAPKLLQINMGPSRAYRLRADWTSGFFAAGGLAVLNDTDFSETEEVLKALHESGARAAVITSDDATYVELAESLARSIKASFPELTLYLAGAPGEHEERWRAAGVDDFVHVRVNAYTFNRAVLLKLGAPLNDV